MRWNSLVFAACLWHSVKSLTVTKNPVLYNNAANTANLAKLTTQDQTGTQDTWNKYFEIGGKANFLGNFTFADIPVNSNSFALAVSYRGSEDSYQRTTFLLVDATTKAETLLYSTGPDGMAYTTDWVWSYKTSIPLTGSDLSRFVTSTGRVTLNVRVKAAEAINLDYLALIAKNDSVVGSATTATTTVRSTTTTTVVIPTTTMPTTTTTTTTSSTTVTTTTTSATTTAPTTTPTTTPSTTPSTTPTTITSTPSATTTSTTTAVSSTSTGSAWSPIPTRTASPSWAQYARVADGNPEEGAGTTASQTTTITKLSTANVSVIEIDGSLSSYYTTDAAFLSDGVAPIKSFAQIARSKGLKTVVYYPALEVISDVPNATSRSLCRDYPDWVQVAVDGTKNVFEGSGVVFWVENGQESCWPSPNSPWKDMFYRRIALLANPANQIDGLWPDVPIYFDGVSEYADFSTWGKQAFTNDTGLAPPAAAINWSNPTWRRWIVWRHENLANFLIGAHEAGRSVNPSWQTVVEIVTCDYNDATKIGLDGAYLKNVEGVSVVWEVDAMSDTNAMRSAKADDWLMMYAMYKYGRGASGTKPSWAFDYGKQTDDAQATLALAVTAGNSPYEVKIPTKEAGVNDTMRGQWYSWIGANEKRLLGSRSVARLAVYHSSASRDFTEMAAGSGIYMTTTKPSGVSEWWCTDSTCSTKAQAYLGEYRGAVKALARNHFPFDTLTSPYFSLSELLPTYTTVIAPNLVAASDSEAAVLFEWVNKGGNLLVTGAQPLTKNEYGDARSQSLLSPYLTPATGSGVVIANVGKGSIIHYAGSPFKTYLTNTTLPFQQNTLLNHILALSRTWVRIPAQNQPGVILDVKAVGNEIVVSLVNLSGGTGSFTISPVDVTVQFDTRQRNLESPFLSVPASAVASSTEVKGDVTVSVVPDTDGSTFSVTVRVEVMKLIVVKF